MTNEDGNFMSFRLSSLRMRMVVVSMEGGINRFFQIMMPYRSKERHYCLPSYSIKMILSKKYNTDLEYNYVKSHLLRDP